MNTSKIADKIMVVALNDEEQDQRLHDRWEVQRKKQEEKEKYYTPAQIKAIFKKMPKEEQQQLIDSVRVQYSKLKDEKSVLHKIFLLCRDIIRHDTSFENKTYEWDRAKKAAEEIERDYNELLKLIGQIDFKDLDVVKDMIRMAGEYSWINILSDAMGSELREKLRDLPNHVVFLEKEKIHNFEKTLNEVKIEKKDYESADKTISRELKWL